MTQKFELRLLSPPRVVHWLAALFWLFGLAALIKVAVIEGKIELTRQGIETMAILGFSPYCVYAGLVIFFILYAFAYMMIDLLILSIYQRNDKGMLETIRTGLPLITEKLKSFI